jgi:hypothetical protein
LKRLLRHLFKLILAAIILFLVGFAIVAGLMLMNYESARQMENQELAFLDQQFIAERKPSPEDVTEEIFLPEYVGSFKRADKSDSVRIPCITWKFKNIESCIATVYTSATGIAKNGNGVQIWVYVWRETPPASLNSLVGPYFCNSEIGGEVVLRTQSTISYLYHKCSYFQIGISTLDGVIWQNGDWTIQIQGKFEAIRQFFADYPY